MGEEGAKKEQSYLSMVGKIPWTPTIPAKQTTITYLCLYSQMVPRHLWSYEQIQAL